MKKKILNFICTSNQIILFVAAIIVLFMLTTEALRKHRWRSRYRHDPERVAIVETTETGTTVTRMPNEIKFRTKLSDIYIFEVISETIDPNQNYETMGSSGMGKPSPGYGRNTINLMFSAEGKPNYHLFENDRLILDYTLADLEKESRGHKKSKNIYTVVSTDTNSDGLLGYDDKKDLYVSQYDGSDNKLIRENFSAFDLIADDQLLITSGSRTNRSFHVYNVKEDLTTLLKTDR